VYIPTCRLLASLAVTIMIASLVAGCGSDSAKKDPDFFTSGNREADQRAEQRVAKTQQERGEGASGNRSSGDQPHGSDPNAKRSLFDRLGGEQGVAAVVDDFVTRALADPRVNWERKGVTKSQMLGLKRKSAEWKPTPEAVEVLKKHIRQFITLSTGGNPHYDGLDMKAAHDGLRITNAEFDAAVGDLKATLDKLQIPVPEQKELLSIIESTRPQVVEVR
jgi:hemoglobin